MSARLQPLREAHRRPWPTARSPSRPFRFWPFRSSSAFCSATYSACGGRTTIDELIWIVNSLRDSDATRSGAVRRAFQFASPCWRPIATSRPKASRPAVMPRVEFGEAFETLRRFLVDLLDRLAHLEQFRRGVVGRIESMLARGVEERDDRRGLVGRAPMIDPGRSVLPLCVERAHICPDGRLNFGKRLRPPARAAAPA